MIVHQKLIRRRGTLLSGFALLFWLSQAFAATAQEEPPPPEKKTPLHQGEPFDLLTLKEDNVPREVKVIALKNRRLPAAPKPSDLVRIEYDGKPHDVTWRDIVSIELFEQRVLKEAEGHVAAGRFDNAYPGYAFLHREYPDLPGLAASTSRYLLAEGQDALAGRRYARALAVLYELYELDANAPELRETLGRVVDAVVSRYFERKQYDVARKILTELSSRYKNHETASKWSAELLGQARKIVDTASADLAAERFAEARQQSEEAVRIWPAHEPARQLLADAHARFPIVVVGVSTPSNSSAPLRIDDWAARRSRRLIERGLLEVVRYGADGCEYASPFGTYRPPDVNLELGFSVERGILGDGERPLTGYEISRRLLARANPTSPEFRSDWAGLLAGTAVRDVFDIDVQLKRPHVRPETMLVGSPRGPAASATGESSAALGAYIAVDHAEDHTRYAANPAYFAAGRGQPRQLIERNYGSSAKALSALERGDVNLVDRVNPWEVERIRETNPLQVAAYAAPTVHVLVPNLRRPLTADRTFRRALVYAINRPLIFRELVAGNDSAGRVLSGPLPVGYAYDAKIAPRPYAPRLALTLFEVARRRALTNAEGEDADTNKLPPLQLAHPADDVARLGCRSIARHLEAVGVTVRLHEFTAPPSPKTYASYDLVYAELAITEPLVDLARLLGPQGLAGSSSAYVELALRRLERDGTQSWDKARPQLRELHRITHDDVSVVPLWQLTEHFAYHPCIEGLGARPITLYQNIERWQTTPRLLWKSP